MGGDYLSLYYMVWCHYNLFCYKFFQIFNNLFTDNILEMRLLSEIDWNEDSFTNINVAETLKKWFYRSKRLEEGSCIIGSFEIRQLNQFEESIFGLESRSFTQNVKIGHKVNSKYNLYFSRGYQRSEKNGSYVVKFVKDEEILYGRINYFLQIDDCTYASLNILEPTSQRFFNLKGNYGANFRSVFLDSKFSYAYVLLLITENETLIHLDQIVCKCFCVHSDQDDNNMYVSDYLNENEHD